MGLRLGLLKVQIHKACGSKCMVKLNRNNFRKIQEFKNYLAIIFTIVMVRPQQRCSFIALTPCPFFSPSLLCISLTHIITISHMLISF